MARDALPAGYVHVTAGRCVAVVRAGYEVDARAMLAQGTLYEAAMRDPAARPLAGRGVAYAIALPVTKTRAVVRHNRHGGLLAPLTRDLFLPPTRAPYELATALRLAHAGVATPDVLMYGTAPALGLWCRADVVTREVEGGCDLSHYMMPGESETTRREAWRATRALVDALNAARARHHDLNVKNILLAPTASAGRLEGWVLDVDRVTFNDSYPTRVRAGNAARLLRSARKWRDKHGAVLDERELAPLIAAVHSSSAS